MKRARSCSDDSGAALIVALIIVTVFGLIIGATLTFADTSIRATVQLRDQGAVAYAADGATKAAVNSIRNSTFTGTSGQCFGASGTLNLAGFYAARSAAVTCAPSPGSRVRVACTSLTNCNRPGAAILTLGNIAGEDGLYVKSNTGAGLHVHGVVMSNSNINITNSALATNTGVYARGGAAGCTGPVTSDTSPPTAKTCQESSGSALNVDPNYAAETSSVPVYRPVPACPGGSSVTLQPGYYDDAAALTALTGGTCTNKTWYFAPGNYYFDFHNTENPALPTAGGDVWTVSNGNLIAGTPTAAGLLATPTIPGGCVNPIDSATALGVQFIFGNDSQLFINNKVNAEFCGTYHADRPPVVMYGLKTGSESTSSVTGLNMTTTVDAGQFTNVPRIGAVDNSSATWDGKVTAKKAVTGTMTVGGFGPAVGSIPAGSTLKSATLRVVHAFSAGAAGTTGDTRTLLVTPTGGTALAAVSLPAVTSTVTRTDSVTLPLAALNSLSTQIHNGTFTGVNLTYSATIAESGTESVDAILLDLTYAAPAFRAQSGCITKGPYVSNSSSICAFISTAQSPSTVFYIQGTTYAPLAALDVSFNNLTEQVFRFGVVARSLKIFETASLAFTGPVIEVPDDSPGIGFGVFLSTFVCSGLGPCSTSGIPDLTALVTFVDPVAGVTAGQREVHVLSWAGSR
ncbi:hypothetical protein SAMN04515671_3432 [Nakamurella panacisegetis]|uniref:Tfp pilus assembly protein PilX n=1 Tax=Nakamurella panacisegetis TaxID=1090615 RepID=A0A1H0R7E5_9ACTN|nr:hypothetical protein [Nakamurella panacisegetis]SDP25453.1 hypothetical protein SAMN04515671_3432 [Nakamurella panacisegetis]